MTKVSTISSQDFRDDAVVARKLAARDFTVTVSPCFEIDGETFRVVLDGHHALSAAIEAGEDPEFVEADARVNDALCLLNDGDIIGFLEAAHLGNDYRDVFTGRSAF